MDDQEKQDHPEEVPVWDNLTRTLRFAGVLLKELRQPACNQVQFFEGCQRQGYAKRMENPLTREPGESDEDLQQRLHNTMQDVNRGLLQPLLRFRGDGKGFGIRWEDLRPGHKPRRRD
jgi:hypothetical protein